MPLKLKKFINSILIIIFLLSCSTRQKDTEKKDFTLIIPGKYAESFTLSDTASAEETASQIDISSMPESLLPFTSNNQIHPFTFNRIIYLKNRYALFTDKGIVKAIAGLSPANRVTDDAVKLTDGADSFIMNYGNSGLAIINNEGHRIYIYKKMGIAIFDDNSDDSIDMYLIFSPEQ